MYEPPDPYLNLCELEKTLQFDLGDRGRFTHIPVQ